MLTNYLAWYPNSDLYGQLLWAVLHKQSIVSCLILTASSHTKPAGAAAEEEQLFPSTQHLRDGIWSIMVLLVQDRYCCAGTGHQSEEGLGHTQHPELGLFSLEEKAEQTSCLPLPTATCCGVGEYMEVRAGLGQREREQTHPSGAREFPAGCLTKVLLRAC